MGCSSYKSYQTHDQYNSKDNVLSDDEHSSIGSVLQTESITFEVESGLKPKYSLDPKSIDEILSSIFKRNKKTSRLVDRLADDYNILERKNENNWETAKIFFSNFDTKKKSFIIMEKSHYFVD